MTKSKQTLRLGTRGSRLALKQADMVAQALAQAWPALAVEIIVIRTSGDWTPDQGEVRLPEDGGGKAYFAKEIEEALRDGRIDCGVHSLKDMAAVLPDGLVIHHMLPRADARDAFLANGASSVDALPPGAIVGTASPRRQAFLLARRPDLKIVPLRGNVPTRIEKLRAGQVDATLLAVAGLARLGLEGEIAAVLGTDIMLPAAGQGVIGIELRAGDVERHALFDEINCARTALCAAAERAAVAALNGTCHTPIGAHAVIAEGILQLDVALVAEDGGSMVRDWLAGPVADRDAAEALGSSLGDAIRRRAGR